MVAGVLLPPRRPPPHPTMPLDLAAPTASLPHGGEVMAAGTTTTRTRSPAADVVAADPGNGRAINLAEFSEQEEVRVMW